MTTMGLLLAWSAAVATIWTAVVSFVRWQWRREARRLAEVDALVAQLAAEREAEGQGKLVRL